MEAAIWGINAFDQWGVELGKEMATDLLPAVTGDRAGGNLRLHAGTDLAPAKAIRRVGNIMTPRPYVART